MALRVSEVFVVDAHTHSIRHIKLHEVGIEGPLFHAKLLRTLCVSCRPTLVLLLSYFRKVVKVEFLKHVEDLSVLHF